MVATLADFNLPEGPRYLGSNQKQRREKGEEKKRSAEKKKKKKTSASDHGQSSERRRIVNEITWGKSCKSPSRGASREEKGKSSGRRKYPQKGGKRSKKTKPEEVK